MTVSEVRMMAPSEREKGCELNLGILPTRAFLWALVLTIGVAAAASLAIGQTAGSSPPVTSGRSAPAGQQGEKEQTPFIIMPEGVFLAEVRSSGRIFVSPMYLDSWPKETERLRNGATADRVVVYLCSGGQFEALEAFLGVADTFVVWPFIQLCDQGPEKSDQVWPGLNHPLVNRLRKMRSIAAGKRLYASVPAGRIGPRTFWPGNVERGAAFEEAQWMTLAVIGADWDGILWYDLDVLCEWACRMSEIEDALKQLAGGLAAAWPVGWVETSGNAAASALFSGENLFVVLLNPSYMTVGRNGACVLVPDEPTRLEGELVMRPPEDSSLQSGRTLLGEPLELVRDGGAVRVNYGFSGGGEMLVFDLNPNKDAQAARAGSHDEREEERRR